MYNTEHVAAAEVPNAAPDFLKPQFKGRMVTPYPADDDATLWLFHKIVLKYGWDYMDKYMANKPNFIQGHLGQQRSIASGQNWVTFNSIFNITTVEKKAGKPVEFAFLHDRPDADLAAHRRDLQGRAASQRGEAVPRLADGAGTAGRDRHLVVAQGRPPPAGFKPIFDYPVVNDYRKSSSTSGSWSRCASGSKAIPDRS